jgi:hypothetical protein
MIIINGVRYRPEDAERLGRVPAPEKTAEKAVTPKNKAAIPANK